ncbi:hypothetical protein CMQ_5807 [Grosmannia clavigera kw1407]|uniref:Uncharacterized protein n=1 Tax=Grosmannia clavigera (strain kw1407 / UAMH 11150) TaxID=655863 RepID=F0XSN0_GROCL|nr:uncharacterized protein CMQ_5807 [Grosmannia clavigera kw1407]EFW99386.1 hypothetical protein CMQ_5807 [Grosmannia clavigera kw1407]
MADFESSQGAFTALPVTAAAVARSHTEPSKYLTNICIRCRSYPSRLWEEYRVKEELGCQDCLPFHVSVEKPTSATSENSPYARRQVRKCLAIADEAVSATNA